MATTAATTKAELRKLLPWWIGRFRLWEWEVNLSFNTEVGDGLLGQCRCQLPYRRAWIDMLDLSDEAWEKNSDTDPEVVLVHELIHVKAWPMGIENDDPLSIFEEWLCADFSTAFVALRRNQQKPPNRKKVKKDHHA